MGIRLEIEHHLDKVLVLDCVVVANISLGQELADLVFREWLLQVAEDLANGICLQLASAVLVEDTERVDKLTFRISFTRVAIDNVHE